MDIKELKRMEVGDLARMATDLEVENAGNLPYRDLLYKVIRAHASKNGSIVTEGVLEKLNDGYGFLRAPEASYLPGPDDIYVSPSQIRRFNLMTGDTVSGQIRLPKPGERYFALGRVEKVNGVGPEDLRNRLTFDRLTPLYPRHRLHVEIEGETWCCCSTRSPAWRAPTTPSSPPRDGCSREVSTPTPCRSPSGSSARRAAWRRAAP
jgi:transcription termination factor Rho